MKQSTIFEVIYLKKAQFKNGFKIIQQKLNRQTGTVSTRCLYKNLGDYEAEDILFQIEKGILIIKQ